MENNSTAQTDSRTLRRRLDDWTLYTFNPAFARNGTALSDLIARQESTHRKNRSTTSMTDSIRRVLRRLDDWTLTVFNPHYPSDHRS